MSGATLKAGAKLAAKGNVDGLRQWLQQRAQQDGTGRARFGAVNGSGDTLLHLAARHGHRAAVDMLLQEQDLSSQEIDARNKVGHTPLHEASLCGDDDCVQQLLAASADVHIAKHADWTALHLAATKPHATVINRLLGAGADAARLNKDGWTPLHIACKVGSVDVVSSLYKAHPAAATTPSRTKRTPLMTAVTHNHPAVVKLLLSWGASPSATDTCGWTALSWAVAAGARECVHLLLSHDADPTHTDDEGRAALHISAMSGLGSETFATTEEDAMHILHTIQARCPEEELNRADAHGLTPLHLAAMHGHAQHVGALIAAGADASATDTKGRTPLDLAQQRGRTAVERMLQAHAHAGDRSGGGGGGEGEGCG